MNQLLNTAVALNQAAWTTIGQPTYLDYATAIALLSSVVVIWRWLRV